MSLDQTLLDKFPPEEERNMLTEGYKWTVCEVLRDIYKMTEDPEIRLRCRVATTMAKHIVKKLYQYSPNGENRKNLLQKIPKKTRGNLKVEK